MLTRASKLLLLSTISVMGCGQTAMSTTDAGGAIDAAVAADAPSADAPGSDAPTADAAAIDASADGGDCAQCLADPIAWGTDGGLACTRDSSSLAPCDDYTHARVAEACDPPDVTCTNPLPSCRESELLGPAAIAEALADPDVVAALAAAPILYGTDPRPSDGSVDWFTVGASGRVDVGLGTVPAGVAAFVDLLHRLDMQQLGRAGCVEVFPGG